MKSSIAFLSLVLLVSLTPACTTPTPSTSARGDPNARSNWERFGQVESIQETRQYHDGDPKGGSVAGAVIGEVLGSGLGGHGLGTFLGASEGASIGASSSRIGYPGHNFEVLVHFDDGGSQNFIYENQLPFRPGEYVIWTARGLARR
jgi:outer membrane lipoprotein SlyB